MSRTQGDDCTAEAAYRDPPPGRPFDAETAQEAAQEVWHARRRKVLKKYGLWETWRAVPPESEREKALDEYLPGGQEYE